MRNSNVLLLFILTIAGCTVHTDSTPASKNHPASASAKDTTDRDTTPLVRSIAFSGGRVVYKKGTHSEILTTQALQSWQAHKGDFLYSTAEGSGGYENEGQALFAVDINSGKPKKLLSEYYAIDTVRIHFVKNEPVAYVVIMSDGGLGANHVAVVHPQRGEVFRDNLCVIGALSGDSLVLHYYSERGWGVLIEGDAASAAKVKPDKTKSYSLKTLLNSPVIINRKSYEDWGLIAIRSFC